jgi:hypothetical protein
LFAKAPWALDASGRFSQVAERGSGAVAVDPIDKVDLGAAPAFGCPADQDELDVVMDPKLHHAPQSKRVQIVGKTSALNVVHENELRTRGGNVSSWDSVGHA